MAVLLCTASANTSQQQEGSLVTVQITDDVTGASEDLTVPVDGLYRSIPCLAGDMEGSSKALGSPTSAQLTNFMPGVVCKVRDCDGEIASLDSESTFTVLHALGKSSDDNVSVNVSMDINQALLSCHICPN